MLSLTDERKADPVAQQLITQKRSGNPDSIPDPIRLPRAIGSFGASIQSLTALDGSSDREPSHVGWRP
jgi:hypothetical protein